MCENGLIKLEEVDNRPNLQKECLTLWLRWFLKRMWNSNCVLAQYFEEDEISEWDGRQKCLRGKQKKNI